MNKDFKYYRPLKYSEYKVTFSEVPDEVSLNFSLTGCEIKCKDCHSKYLWEYNDGKELYLYDLCDIIDKYKNYITTVCFMGGDDNQQLFFICKSLKTCYPNIKICIYSGKLYISQAFKKYIDYYKVGPYNEHYGSLKKSSTNQKMFKKVGSEWLNITHKFWK
jgi:anaerobic ribonucleoside-triphosphate reductase activating protein